jgi:hypothetical protein
MAQRVVVSLARRYPLVEDLGAKSDEPSTGWFNTPASRMK